MENKFLGAKMENKIKVEIKDIYGKRRIYPACAVADAFSQLTKTKTFSTEHLKTIKALGFKIEVAQVSL